MTKLQTQLLSAAKSIAGLAVKLEKIAAQLGKTPVAKKAVKKKAPTKKKTVAKKKPVKKAIKKVASKKKPSSIKKKPSSIKSKDTVLENVFDVIRRSRNGATIASLKAKTLLESRQLSNALYKLSKKNRIKSKSRGVYIKA